MVAWKASDDWCDEITIAVFDAPITFIAPVGKDRALDQPRAAAHLAGKDFSRVDSVLFSEDALHVLGLHVAETVVAVVALLTTQGRSVEPREGSLNTVAVQLTVTSVSVWLGIVLPFCLGLFVLWCTAAAHARGLNDLPQGEEELGAPPATPPPHVNFRHKPSLRIRNGEDEAKASAGASASVAEGDGGGTGDEGSGGVVVSSSVVTSNPLGLDSKTMEILKRSASMDDKVHVVT